MILLLVWLVLKGPPPRYSGLPGVTRSSLLTCFQRLFFSQRLFPKISKIESPKSLKISSFCKKSASKRTHDQGLGKHTFQRGQTSEIDNSYTLSAVFQEAQGSPKEVKMEARMESLGTQNHTNPETRTLEKKATSRDRKKWVHGHLGGGSANALFSIKSHNHPRNRPYRPPGLHDRPQK